MRPPTPVRGGALAAAVTLALVLGPALGPAPPAGAQPEPSGPTTTGEPTGEPTDGPVEAGPGSDQPPGRPRVVDLAPRVVDLSVRVASTDDAQLSVETPSDRAITLASDVLFETDRSDLDADARARVDAIADELVDLGPRTVTIEGHTDDTGTPEHNQGLSERRAFAVSSRLEAQLNDDEFVLEYSGLGETRPVASNGSEEGRALNRRVVIAYPTG